MDEILHEVASEILGHKKTTKEMKIFLIIEMLDEKLIKRKEAHELCVEYGLYKNSYNVIDEKTLKTIVKLLEKRGKEE